MNRVQIGDCRTILPTLPEKSFHTCVTSPPYFGLRDYGTARWEGGSPECDHFKLAGGTGAQNLGKSATASAANVERASVPFRGTCGKCGATRHDSQIGLEPTPDAYVAELVSVFREVRRVLRDDGTLWLNLGDSYAGSWGAQSRPGNFPSDKSALNHGQGARPHHKYKPLSATQIEAHPKRTQTETIRQDGLKPKDLIGIPWRVAFALQADGWTLRSDIVWAKPNPMPESVTDRPTKSHEYLFMFSKARWVGPDAGRYAGISDTDARWLALFLDTEGNITVKRVQREGRQWFGAQIGFSSTSRELLDAAKEIIGGGTILDRPGTNAPMFYLQLSNRMAADLLRRVYPFLIVKRRQARIAIHLQTLLRHRGGRGPDRFRTDQEVATLESLWLRNKECNHFGAPNLDDVPEPGHGRWVGGERYYYDAAAIAEPISESTKRIHSSELVRSRGNGGWKMSGNADRNDGDSATLVNGPARLEKMLAAGGRNRRSVWTIPTTPYSGAHFAVMPEKLVEPCILAGCPEGGIVLDPFFGSGTVGQVAERLGRRWFGCELNPAYKPLIDQRTAQVGLVFSEKAAEP